MSVMVVVLEVMKIVMKKLNMMFKKVHDTKTSNPTAYRTLQDWEYLVSQVDGQYGGWFEYVYDSDNVE